MTGRELYDQQIAPLMERIDAIADKNGIAYIAAFQYAEDGVAYSCALKASSDTSLQLANRVIQSGIVFDEEEEATTNGIPANEQTS